MVAVPTSKLRLAWASCSEIATFCPWMNARLSCEERLRERHGISVRITQTILILLRRCASERYGDVVVLGERRGVDGGQDLGKALGQTFKTRVARRTRRGVGGIVRERVAIDLQKVGCARRRSRQCNGQ